MAMDNTRITQRSKSEDRGTHLHHIWSVWMRLLFILGGYILAHCFFGGRNEPVARTIRDNDNQ